MMIITTNATIIHSVLKLRLNLAKISQWSSMITFYEKSGILFGLAFTVSMHSKEA